MSDKKGGLDRGEAPKAIGDGEGVSGVEEKGPGDQEEGSGDQENIPGDQRAPGDQGKVPGGEVAILKRGTGPSPTIG